MSLSSGSRQSKSSRLFYLVVGVLSLLLFAVSGLAYYQSKNSGQAYRWVEETLAMQNALERVLSTMKDMETGSRGYLLSNRDKYLKPYLEGETRIEQELAALQELTEESLLQQGLFTRANLVIQEKLDLMKRVVDLARSGQRDAATAFFLTDRGMDAMDRVRSYFAEMQQHERKILEDRQARKAEEVKNIDRVIDAIVIVNCLVVLLLVWLVRKIDRLQKIVTVCAWSKTIELDGEWLSFEEYLRRKLQVEISHGISKEELAKLQNEIRGSNTG